MSLNHAINSMLAQNLVWQTNSSTAAKDGQSIDFMPPNRGKNGQFLSTDGQGNVYWANDPIQPDNPQIQQTIYPKDATVDVGTSLKPFPNIYADNYKVGNLIEGIDQPGNKIDLNTSSDINLVTSGVLRVNGQVVGTDADITDLENKTQNINLANTTAGVTTFDGLLNTDTLQVEQMAPSTSTDIVVRDGITIKSNPNIQTQIQTNTNKTQNINENNTDLTRTYFNNLIESNQGYKITGKTSQDYLLADGSTTTLSPSPQAFYLYNSNTNTSEPPQNGQIRYNNSIQQNASQIYISNRTRDGIDVSTFLQIISPLTPLLIQDQTDSDNYIIYNVVSTITNPDYLTVNVTFNSGAGTGLTNYPSGRNIFLVIQTNDPQIANRLNALESKTQNQTAILNTTTFTGNFVQNLNGNLLQKTSFNDTSATSFNDANISLSIQGNGQEAMAIGRSKNQNRCYIAVRNDEFDIQNNLGEIKLKIPATGNLSIPNTGLSVNQKIEGIDQPTNKIDLNSSTDVNIETAGVLKVNNSIIATDADVNALEEKTQNISVDPIDPTTQTIFSSLISGTDKTNTIDLNQPGKVLANGIDITKNYTLINNLSIPVTTGNLNYIGPIEMNQIELGSLIKHTIIWGEDFNPPSGTYPVTYNLHVYQQQVDYFNQQISYFSQDSINVTRELKSYIRVTKEPNNQTIYLRLTNNRSDRTQSGRNSLVPFDPTKGPMYIKLELVNNRTNFTLYPLFQCIEITPGVLQHP